MAKDRGLAQAAANAAGQDTPFGAMAAQRLVAFVAGDGVHLDFSVIYTTIAGDRGPNSAENGEGMSCAALRDGSFLLNLGISDDN